MQTTTFIKTIKWLYGLEIHETLGFFRTGFQEYLTSGRAGIASRIEDAYNRGISLNNQVRLIEANAEATRILDAFALTDLYDPERWQTVVSTFLQVLAAGDDDKAAQEETIKETLAGLDSLAERIQILVSCVGPLQQLCVPTSVLRLSDYDDVLTLEVRSSSAEPPESGRIENVFAATGELYATLCQIEGTASPQPLRVIQMNAEAGFRLDLTGETVIVTEFKKLLVELWQHIRNQDLPRAKDIDRAILAGLAPSLTIAKRVKQRKLSAAKGDQLRSRLSTLAVRLFDQGVKIREIPDTDVVDNRQLLEQIQQQRHPTRAKPVPEANKEAAKQAQAKQLPAAKVEAVPTKPGPHKKGKRASAKRKSAA